METPPAKNHVLKAVLPPPGSAFVAVNHIRDMRVGAACRKHVNNDPALKLFFLCTAQA